MYCTLGNNDLLGGGSEFLLEKTNSSAPQLFGYLTDVIDLSCARNLVESVAQVAAEGSFLFVGSEAPFSWTVAVGAQVRLSFQP